MRCSKPTKMLRVAAALLLTTNLVTPSWAFTPGTNDQNTTTPVKHVIVIYGENRSFDHLYRDMAAQIRRVGAQSTFGRHLEH